MPGVRPALGPRYQTRGDPDLHLETGALLLDLDPDSAVSLVLLFCTPSAVVAYALAREVNAYARESGEIVVKDLRNGEQQTVPLADAVERVGEVVARD